MKLKKPLYDPSSTSDYGNLSFTIHLKSKLQFLQTVIGLFLFLKKPHGVLKALTRTFVDDTISADRLKCVEKPKITDKDFESKPLYCENVQLAGIQTGRINSR